MTDTTYNRRNFSAILCAGVYLLSAPAQVFAKDLVAEFIRASEVDLENPHDVKLSPDGRYLFVSDVGNNRVAILDPVSLQIVDSFGADHQSGTHDIDFDAVGNVYVADTHNNRVTIYQLKGTQAQLSGEISGGFKGPEGVLAHPNGRIYIAGAWSNNVVAFENGKLVAELTGLSSPHDLEHAKNGDIWLSDAGNNRMLLLSPDLKIKKELQGAPYNFNGVRYQDVLADGTLIAADKNNHRVIVIAPDHSIRLVIGTGKPEIGPGKFRTPEGIETRKEKLWISDSGNDRVVIYRLKSN
jgi:DNA-binding beta-propeller fold protein YncE